MPPLKLDTPLEQIGSIQKRFLLKLKRLELKTVKDLLWHFPTRYEDWSEISPIAELKPGDEKTIQGEVISINLVRTPRRRMFIVEALISDNSGSITAVWFNQPYIKKSLPPGKLASFSGKTTLYKNRLVLQNPTYETLARTNAELNADLRRKSSASVRVQSAPVRDTRHTARIVPIYRETKGLTSKGIRHFVDIVFERIERIQEFIPPKILKNFGLPEINDALRQIHFPNKQAEATRARKSFAFRELFLLQLKNLEQRETLKKQEAYSVKYDLEDIRQILAELPFELTLTQKKSLWEILQDISRPHPMSRLLQGDVGSGKTIVAGLAAITVVGPPYNLQAAFMAPTEILARQHYQTLTKFFKEFEGGIALLVSKEARVFYEDGLEKSVKKPQLAKDITAGKIKIVVGTHALIQKTVSFNKLALVVVDEQHRFGVRQRAELVARGQTLVPHFLSMSATPIPRTLMLSVFGDLDLSLISELPKGRKEIITKIVAPANRDKAYAFIRGEVRKGKQVFVVCPRIEPRTDADDTQTYADTVPRESALSPRESALLEVKSVKEEYEKLSKKVFPDLRVAMLHGKLKSEEKKKIMSAFASSSAKATADKKASADETDKIDILVSTSVIEVGVDVPNATIMMIEGAERFGLAQLYQFRGRVGRGEKQSFCFLFTESSSRTTHQRLQSLLTAKNGFELAELDLKIRGPGEFLGSQGNWAQTGLPDVAMRALQSPELLRDARAAAEEITKEDPELKKYPLLKRRLQQFEREIHLE